jgi:hypothetical protein
MGAKVAKLLFIPFSIVGGILAGIAGKQLFSQLWGLVDKEEPPGPEHRRASVGKVVTAAALQGAVFSGVRALADRGSRRAFHGLTGAWPGEERPEPE